MTIYRGTGGGGNATTDSEIALLTQLEQSSSSSAAAAAASAAAALVSENNAETAETNAAASETAAAASASSAATSATNAASSASSASTSATNAANSASAAATSESNAASSASAAATSATNAATSETNAASSASAAATSATNAANSASAASTSATNAANSASAAVTSESNAASSASAAATSASNAATSESNAAASAAAAATFDPANFVDLVNNQTIGGAKTFSNTITGSISGNAATATTATSATSATNIAGGAAGNIPMQTAAGTTSFYTGQLAGMRNKIINGKMEIAQRGTSFAAIANTTYSLDRWRYEDNTTSDVTASQASDVPSSNEFQSSLRFTVTTADTSIATGEVCGFLQRIEGYNVRDLIGKAFTLSFWVRSSKTGIHCVSFRNSGDDRTYVAEYTISAANTWEQKSVTVSGGLITAGTWDWTNGRGIEVNWALAAGSTFQTTAGAWQTGSFRATANQVNCLDTIGNIFAITGVQLEVGEVATPFEHRPYGAELALCQRYYEKSRIWARFQSASGGTYINSFSHRQAMRGEPTLTKESETVVGAGTTNTLSGSNSYNLYVTTTTTSTTQAGFTSLIYAADAEL